MSSAVSRWCIVHPELQQKGRQTQNWSADHRVPQHNFSGANQKVHKEDPWLMCVWVQSEHGNYSSLKSIFMKINLQVFIGFGSLPCCQSPGQLMFCVLWHTAHSSCVPACADSSVLFLALRCGECCSCSIQVLITCPSHCFLWAHYSKAYFIVCQMLGAFAHVIEMYFLVCSVCMWMIPCAIKVPSDALLVTTLKKHMSAAVRCVVVILPSEVFVV